ncbi:hypothetical protein GE061_012595 [Apolygus lucorum]|uniref:MARVEL domain-containing protein n=1 Tax=Apolygus lucorum TaxID=248454 RepID=A0A6A4JN92_APOLU|nr:hypothetical protein GE061_012595 [Apolygus lucorum]
MELLDSLINKFPSTSSCCCGCSLETGCKIIGWVQTIVSGIGLVLYVIILVSFALLITVSPGASIFGILITIISGLTYVGIFLLGLYLLSGVYHDDANKLKIWLYGNVILLSVHAVLFILDLIGSIFTLGLMIGPLLSTLIWMCVTVYCIAVVKSFRDERSRQPEA